MSFPKIFLSTGVVLFLLVSCNRNAEIVRELHYVDLLKPENLNFYKYPNEFNTYILNGVLEGDIQAYDIDYDSSGQISPLEINEFVFRILEPYEEYPEEDTNSDDEETNSYVHDFLPSVTLLGFDDLMSNEESLTTYINFYHPGEVTLEGFNKYICSIDYKEAIDYLASADPQIIWHNYKYQDWGWFNGRLFIPQAGTSSKLAVDMILMTDSSTLLSKLSDETSVAEVRSMAENNPYYMNSILDTSGGDQLTVIYKNDSVLVEIATFTFDEMQKIAGNMKIRDSVTIMPVQTAILSKQMKPEEKVRRISQNGKFEKPLNGNDALSKKIPRKSIRKLETFPGSQKFYFRTIKTLTEIEELLEEDLPGLLYDGVRNGEITVYRSDTLNIRLLPGDFFNNMILNDQDNIPAKTKFLEINQVITETVFEQDGTIISQSPVGVGLFLPGDQVPEGLNRLIGYFKTTEINDYLKSLGKDEIIFSKWQGYPLKSWNITLLEDN